MTVGGALLLYAALLGALGPRARRANAWLARAPRLEAVVLLAAAWSVLTALFLAGLTIALPATALSAGLSDLLGACILRLRAAYLTPGGAAVAGAGLTLSCVVAGRIGWAAVSVVRGRRQERRRQRMLITLCGRRDPELAAVVLDQRQPAAYCLAGRDKAVILTNGAIDLLTEDQLRAVLAHEQGHLRARHHRLLAAASMAGAALPELPLMRDLSREVRGLLEMHADDLAAHEHDPETLATALVAVATAAASASTSTAPAAALAAAEHVTAARIRRLLLPPGALSTRRMRSARAAVAAFGVLPLLLAATPAAVAVNQAPLRQTSTVSSSTRQVVTASASAPVWTTVSTAVEGR